MKLSASALPATCRGALDHCVGDWAVLRFVLDAELRPLDVLSERVGVCAVGGDEDTTRSLFTSLTAFRDTRAHWLVPNGCVIVTLMLERTAPDRWRVVEEKNFEMRRDAATGVFDGLEPEDFAWKDLN